MDYKIASVATKWWIDQMKQQCKKLYPNKVTGDNSNLVIVDESLQNELSRFEEILFKKIYHHVTFKCYLSLTCCYWRPSGDLGIIVRKTSIPKDYLPERANMQIYDGFIEVSLNGEDLHKLPLSTE